MDYCEAWNVLWVEGRPSTLDAWRALSEAAEEARERERESSISVQRVFRGQRVRAWKAKVTAASLAIERTFRGRQGRLRHAAREAQWRDRESSAILHYFATDCQRAFRGFYSRRYVHDFEARKTYLLSVVCKGNELRLRLEMQLQDQMITEAQAAEEKKAIEFREVTQQLHHLVSTASIPGVYNSPYRDPITCGAVGGGLPIETHLCSGVKDLLRLSDYTKPKLSTDLNGTRRNELPYRAHTRASLQAASPYDAVLEASRMDAKLSKVACLGSSEMRAGHKIHYAPYKRGVNDGSAYFDPWKNPLLKRGIPRSKEDLDVATSTIGRVVEGAQPFHTSVGGNKSNVHANGRFDVIHAAETTGGVTRRYIARAMGKVSHSGDVLDAPIRTNAPTAEEYIQGSVIQFNDLDLNPTSELFGSIPAEEEADDNYNDSTLSASKIIIQPQPSPLQTC